MLQPHIFSYILELIHGELQMKQWIKDMAAGAAVVIITGLAVIMLFQMRFPMHQIYFH